MAYFTIPFKAEFKFSQLDVDYAVNVEIFNDLIEYEPNIDEILRAAAIRQNQFPIDRNLLVENLLKQYKDLPDCSSVIDNIHALGKDTTFAITTAHQPILMGGPLYIIYKIMSAITLASTLNQIPDHPYHFVPVFVIGGEDHDFEEVNHFHIYGQKVTWQTDQIGACGRFDTSGILDVLNFLSEKNTNSEFALSFIQNLKQELVTSDNYAQFYHRFINLIFRSRGLVVIDMDQVEFKHAFSSLMKKEVNEKFSLEYITKAQKIKERLGYNPATYLREINLFYFYNGYRLRIEHNVDTNKYHIVDTDLFFSFDELNIEIENHPENFSPNVNLRPLYQECILPSVVYVGGGGEIAYWLERKEQFEYANLYYPVIVRRDSVLWIDQNTNRKMTKLKLRIEDFETPLDQLIREYIIKNTKHTLTLDDEVILLNDIFDTVMQKGVAVDKSLSGAIEAEKIKVLKSMEHLQQRIIRGEKQLQEQTINQIQHIEQKLFPQGIPQERYENFLQYYFKLGDGYLDVLEAALDPLRSELKVILEDGTF
jgi:bacillithiol synthase